MNIVIINGSPRKNGNTYRAVQIFKDDLLKIDPDITFTEYFLPQDMPEFCRGCFTCFTYGEDKCPHAQYVQPILDDMLAADGIIFTSPVYALHCSAGVKALLDHLAYIFVVHRARPGMVGKNVFILSTTAGAGTKGAIKPIQDSVIWWGATKPLTYRLAVMAEGIDSMPAKRQAKLTKALERKAYRFYSRMDKKRKPTLLFRASFHMLCRQRVKLYPPLERDLNYWNTQGWTADKRPW
ncbi:NAD(P)H-dependent oxidoreductase [Hydrogenoanaerobacterium sp.]|uniref:flavodoxin family protein n=1 Tax=Hydrogenoanaerobacterium sp. TaxID=2953763 RepID=UPI0028986A5D|nr:NAD(P)H-dependent oxidoreductase [Hydrogenoanaerobacterium sp.]